MTFRFLSGICVDRGEKNLFSSVLCTMYAYVEFVHIKRTAPKAVLSIQKG